MRTLLAILTGKLIAYFSKTLKIGGGTAAPGLCALRIDPWLIERLIHKIPKNVVITGTNGKTTTARILSHFAKEAGLKVIRNHTGSNLERGIASALIANYQLPTTNYQLDLGIWELDEFVFNLVLPKIKPDIVLLLNVSRDQLDRYGEVDKVVNRWCQTLSRLDPKTIVLINPNLAKLKNYFKGVKEFEKPKDIKVKGLEGSSFKLKKLKIDLPLPGLYNIDNAAAAATAAHYLNLPISPLTKFQPAFGRFEKLPFGYIFLIKNPASATSVFETINSQIKPQDRLLIALNDNLADGTDVSWIWDAGFELLCQTSHGRGTKNKVYVSGTRAADLALRLKYAGFEPESIHIEPDLKNALKEARKTLKGMLFILPTYTALLELQKILAKQGIKQHYWQESS